MSDQCKMCQDSGEMKVERARTIGYTKGDDTEIVDEHLEPCTHCLERVECDE
jgi:hypothetical protein